MTQRQDRKLGPDFFIVGAPKCGTTSIYAYLQAHPQIFLAPKEPHYFGSDLEEVWIGPRAGRRSSSEEYFGWFTGSDWALRRGDASGWYLRSRVAAREIHGYNPDARIIAAVRNPLDMLPSFHSQALYDGVEDLPDFADALAAETDRREGRRIPPNNSSYPWRLFYRESARFSEQLRRYFEVFGSDAVRVVVFDDLVADPERTYRDLLDFLTVDQDFLPDFEVMNPNKRIRSGRIQNLIWQLSDPASRVRRIATKAIPAHALRSVLLRHGMPALDHFNTVVGPRDRLNPAIRRQLAEEFAEEIENLGRLLDRDLSHWYLEAADGGQVIGGDPSAIRYA